MLIQVGHILTNKLTDIFRICLIMTLVVLLQSNLVHEVFTYFHLDKLELLSENPMEQEKESENEEKESERSDVDEYLQEFFDYAFNNHNLLSPFDNFNDRSSSSEIAIHSPPPDISTSIIKSV